MRTATVSALQASIMLGGVASLVLAGVGLHINERLDEFFIKVDPSHERWALREIEWLAEDLGYEMMPEWECPAEHLPDGAVRHWLAEKEVADDSGAYEAVRHVRASP
jgi:hypothetical protein